MKIKKTSNNFNETIRIAIELAQETGSFDIEDSILFAALLSVHDSAAVRALAEFDIDVESTIENILSNISKNRFPKEINFDEENKNTAVNPIFKKIIEDAYKVAINMSAPYVGTEHLLISWYENTENEIKNNLIQKGVDHQALYNAIKNTVKYPVFIDDKSLNEKSSILKMIGRNLTDLARKGLLDPVVGREKEMDRLESILSRRTKNNPILIGDAGVGKTAIVEGFAQKIVDGNVPYTFKDKTIWQIDSAVLFAGSPMRGDIENKLLALIDEVSADKNIILFIDEIHSFIGSSQASSSGTDVANVLKPALAKGQLRCIGATTYSEYVKYIESDSALARRFQPITVDEIDAESARIILNKIKPTLENHHRVFIPENIVEEAIELSDRYITDRYLPDKAIDLLDEASAKVSLRNTKSLDSNIKMLVDLENEQRKLIEIDDIDGAARVRKTKRELEKVIDSTSIKKIKNSLKGDDIKEVVSSWTGIPITSLTTADIKKIKNLAKILSEKVVGQSKAVKIVADSLQVAKVGISDQSRPMSSFLFAGPTGVGKTELARQIAKTLFGSRDSLVQMDMSEYMEAHSVSKLIGSPPGYIGFDTGGQLTEKIRKRPYSVVLFDEIEKAHPDVLNVLLQILEEGKLTDSKGRVANFKNCVIIMTTNLGAQAILNDDLLGLRVPKQEKTDEKAMEKAYEEMSKEVLDQLKGFLQPEFINRIDHIVIFRTLNEKDVELIASIQLEELSERVRRYKKISVEFDKNVKKVIAKQGFDESYGARNIKRKINEMVESEISKYLLENPRIKEGIQVQYKDSKIAISSMS